MMLWLLLAFQKKKSINHKNRLCRKAEECDRFLIIKNVKHKNRK